MAAVQMTVDGTEFVVDVPGKGEKGYLKRVLHLSELQDSYKAGQSKATILAMVDFLCDLVKLPSGKDAREAILDLSEDGFSSLTAAVKGVGPSPKEGNEPAS